MYINEEILADWQADSKEIGRKNIKNKLYRKLLDENDMEVINEEQLRQVLDNIKYRDVEMARSIVILAYYTGARPNELLRIRARDIQKEGRYMVVKIKGSKKGATRSIWLKFNDLVKEVYTYKLKYMEDIFIFFHLIGRYKQIRKLKNGETKEVIKVHQKVTYWFKKWFSALDIGTVPPYYLRHNRFTKLALEGATDRELKQIKGSRSDLSIEYYIHHSKESGKSIAKKIK